MIACYLRLNKIKLSISNPEVGLTEGSSVRPRAGGSMLKPPTQSLRTSTYWTQWLPTRSCL